MADAIVFAYGDSLPAGVTTAADRDAENGVEMHAQEGEDVKSGESANVPEIGSYLISSEIPEVGVLRSSFVHSAIWFSYRLA